MIDNTIQEHKQKIEEIGKVNKKLDIAGIVLICTFFAYFIFLIYKFDYQNLMKESGKSYEEVLENISPVVGACIIQERFMEPKDIIAILIDLIHRKIINLEVDKESVEKNHIIRQNKDFFSNKENINKLTNIDRQVLDYFLKNDKDKGYRQEIILEEELKNSQYHQLKELQLSGIIDTANEEINNLGANTIFIPGIQKLFHLILMVLIFTFAIFRFGYSVYTTMVYKYSQPLFSLGTIDSMLNVVKYIMFTMFIVAAVSVCLEVIMYFAYLLAYLLNYIIVVIFNKTNGYLRNSIVLDKRAFDMSISRVMKITHKFVLLVSCIAAALLIIHPSMTLFIFIMLCAMIALIVIADDCMFKHNESLTKTVIGLKLLEDRIIHGSFLQEKDIENTKLWGRYLAYTFALGLGDSNEYIKTLNYSKEVHKSKESIASYITNEQVYIDLLKSFMSRA